MNDSMSEMLLVGLSQSEWEKLMQFIATAKSDYEDAQAEGHIIPDIIIQKLINQIY